MHSLARRGPPRALAQYAGAHSVSPLQSYKLCVKIETKRKQTTKPTPLPYQSQDGRKRQPCINRLAAARRALWPVRRRTLTLAVTNAHPPPTPTLLEPVQW